MKLNRHFLIHNTGDEFVLVPMGSADFSGIVRGNQTFGAVLELLGKDTTEEEIIDKMKARFDAPIEKIEVDVKKVLSELKKIGAIDE